MRERIPFCASFGSVNLQKKSESDNKIKIFSLRIRYIQHANLHSLPLTRLFTVSENFVESHASLGGGNRLEFDEYS